MTDDEQKEVENVIRTLEKENKKLKDALNKIAILGHTEIEHTLEMGERALQIANEVLGTGNRWPY